MPKPKGYQVPQAERAKIAAAHRQRNSMVAFAKNMADAASRGDIATAYEILDKYAAEQGHPLTDEDIMAMIKTMLNRLRDKESLNRALSESGIYGRMVNSKSPVQRMSARQYLDAQHERGR
jgi:hypothetical protein